MEVLEIFSSVILQKNVQYFPNISSARITYYSRVPFINTTCVVEIGCNQ